MDIQATDHRSHTGLWVVAGLVILFIAVYWFWGDVISQSLLGQLLNESDLDLSNFNQGVEITMDRHLAHPESADATVRAATTDRLLEILFAEF